MTNFKQTTKKSGLAKKVLSATVAICLSFAISLTAFARTLFPGNNTLANSMVISNVTATSATISFQYLESGFDIAPITELYSKSSSDLYYQLIKDTIPNFPFLGNSNTLKSGVINATGLQANTTYTWFISYSDADIGRVGIATPYTYYNNGIFLGSLPSANGTYQTISFTTPAIGGSYNGTTVTNTYTTTIPANQLPVANAGADIMLAPGITSTTLSGIFSTDTDGGIQYYNWAKTAGPSTVTEGPQGTVTYSLSNLVQGTYTYRLTVTDSRGGVSQDFVNVNVGATPPVNQAPAANAGPDQTITLPTNSATLNGSGTDADGTIASYAWSVASGPNTPTFGSVNTAATSVSNLVQGTYTLQLRVTDNLGATATDIVVITVNAPVTCTNDNFEPNNTSVTASVINVGSSIQAKICLLADEDFYRFNNANNARNIRVTLSALPTNYIVELYAPNGSLAASNSTAGTANKVIVFNTSTVGTYRVKVLAGSGAVANNSNYTLRVETSRNAFAAVAARLATSKLVANDIINRNNLIVYPNPAQGAINVQLPANEVFRTVTLFNTAGSLVKEFNNQQSRLSINTAALKPGIYFLKALNSSNKLFVQKIVVVQ
jgi:hypothetical protein